MRSTLMLGLAAVLLPATADAHIHLTYPMHHTDALTGDQKEEHCGTPGWDRTMHPDRTTVLAPGQTITVTWLETINHPGHFRLSFQPDGQIFGIPPAGNGPPAGYPDQDQTGMTLPDGSTVLADFIADGTLSKQITLPDITCDNCTLQLIQVMTDKPPYTTDSLSDDVYFNCADLVLTANPADAATPDAAPAPDGGVGQDAGNPAMGSGGGCCSVAGGPSGILTALAMVGLLRRRRPRR